MPAVKRDAQFVCEVCGRTLRASDEKQTVLEDVVCCGRPMKTQAMRSRHDHKTA